MAKKKAEFDATVYGGHVRNQVVNQLLIVPYLRRLNSGHELTGS